MTIIKTIGEQAYDSIVAQLGHPDAPPFANLPTSLQDLLEEGPGASGLFPGREVAKWLAAREGVTE